MENPTFTAFAGDRRVASGALETLLREAKRHLERHGAHGLLIFEDATGKPVDFDFRGSADEVVARALAPPRAGPGRPKLGVVSREVTLLPHPDSPTMPTVSPSPTSKETSSTA